MPTGVTVAAIEERVAFLRAAAGDRAEQLELSALVQRVRIDEAPGALDELASEAGLAPEAVEASPFFLVGTVTSVTDKLVALRERLGISYWCVFEPSLDAMAPVVAALAGR